MKKTLLIISALIVGASFLTSCNKKLKEDIEAMEKEIADLKDQQNQTKAILGSDEPILVTTNYLDIFLANKSYTKKYSLKSDDLTTQFIFSYGNNDYYIYIERFNAVDASDFEEREKVFVGFDYDADTKEISNPEVGHKFKDQYGYGSQLYTDDPSGLSADTIKITLTSLNLAARTISLSVDASTEDQRSTKFSFAGKLGYVENTAMRSAAK